ncbi:MAG: FKBP-type peptidyl-prolyl cis-trans isomerase [Thermodesulfobacteriota bacterium]
MSRVKNGANIKVHYTGRLKDGTIFDSSQGEEPLYFTVGKGQVIKGFDKGVLDMEVGEKKSIIIPPEEAYGDYREELIKKVKASQFPDEFEIKEGVRVQARGPENQLVQFVIKEVDGEEVKLDANHELAGKTLIFDLELVDINA